MEKKTKKVLAVVLAIVAILLIALIVLLVVLLPKRNNTPKHTEHTYVYTSVNDSQHKKTCSDCTKIDELEDHTFDGVMDKSCNVCTYTREAPASLVKLSADKTELTAGDTFTLTIEIESGRTDSYLESISLYIGPMIDENTVSKSIAENFEVVNYQVKKLANRNEWYNTSKDLFNSKYGTASFLISYSFIGDKPISSTEKIEITATIKVKETATAVDSFAFGVTNGLQNKLNYSSTDYQMHYYDYAAGISEVMEKTNRTDDVGNKGGQINTLTLSIKANAN